MESIDQRACMQRAGPIANKYRWNMLVKRSDKSKHAKNQKTSIAAQFTETTSILKFNTATARKELSLRCKLSLPDVEIEPAPETAPNR